TIRDLQREAVFRNITFRLSDCISKGADYGERKECARATATGYSDRWIDLRELSGFCSRIHGDYLGAGARCHGGSGAGSDHYGQTYRKRMDAYRREQRERQLQCATSSGWRL